MNRYTYKKLEADLCDLNERLAKANHAFRLAIGSSYNMTTVDVATPEQMQSHCCQRRLTAGTPRECLNDCRNYVLNHI